MTFGEPGYKLSSPGSKSCGSPIIYQFVKHRTLLSDIIYDIGGFTVMITLVCLCLMPMIFFFFFYDSVFVFHILENTIG